jgi:hypothetical protein
MMLIQCETLSGGVALAEMSTKNVRSIALGKSGRENLATMKATVGFLSLVLSLGIGLGVYYMYIKDATPAGGNRVATQAISTTGVEMDLNAIAQAERVYYAQNAAYGTLDQLSSSGALSMVRTGRDGYMYTVDASSSGFTVTATWSPATADQASLHYPTLQVDQTNQIHEVQ